MKYLPGQLNIADALLRHTKTEEKESRRVAEEYIRFVAICSEHCGVDIMVKMKQRLRAKVCWPGINNTPRNFARHVKVVGGLCNPEPLHRTELPQVPWQDIAVYFIFKECRLHKWKERTGKRQTYLIAHRNTPNPNTRVCPSELLLGRTSRSHSFVPLPSSENKSSGSHHFRHAL